MKLQHLISTINRIGNTQINPEPIAEERGLWLLFSGKIRGGKRSQSFFILYLYSDATKQSLLNALELVADLEDLDIVCAPSIGFDIYKIEKIKVQNIYTPKQYIEEYAEEKLTEYKKQVKKINTEYYITPTIVSRKTKTHQNFPSSDQGKLSVLIAAPGQGKTYFTSHHAAHMDYAIPIYISSKQWHKMPQDHLKSLWKTILFCFEYYKAPLLESDGIERDFLTLTLGMKMFSIIFDGFDEYILWNKGLISPYQVLEDLHDMAKSTNTEIMITSRTTFWETVMNKIDSYNEDIQSNLDLFEIKKFTSEQAYKYFENRFDSHETRVQLAKRIYNSLLDTGANGVKTFLGRGFVLNLIGDLVARTDKKFTLPENWLLTNNSFFGWIMEAFCFREEERQRIPIDRLSQLKILQDFAEKICSGKHAKTEELREIILQYNISKDKIEHILGNEKDFSAAFSDHPMIHFDQKKKIWIFYEEQIMYNLLAMRLLHHLLDTTGNGELLVTNFFESVINGNSVILADISNAMVEQVRSRYNNDSHNIFGIITSSLKKISGCSYSTDFSNYASLLASAIIINYTDHEYPVGQPRAERTSNLLKYLGSNKTFVCTHFSGNIVRHDFSNCIFDRCRFDNVYWVNCKFSESTIFRECSFYGGSCSKDFSIGNATFEIPHFHNKASFFIERSQIQRRKRPYQQRHLEEDLRLLVNEFIEIDNVSCKPLSSSFLSSSLISLSPFYSRIMQECKKYLLDTMTSESGSEYFVVKEACLNDMFFTSSQRYFTGVLSKIVLSITNEFDLT